MHRIVFVLLVVVCSCASQQTKTPTPVVQESKETPMVQHYRQQFSCIVVVQFPHGNVSDVHVPGEAVDEIVWTKFVEDCLGGFTALDDGQYPVFVKLDPENQQAIGFSNLERLRNLRRSRDNALSK